MNVILDLALVVAGYFFGYALNTWAPRILDVAKNLYRIEKERVKDRLQSIRTQQSWTVQDPPNFCLWCNSDMRGKIGQFCSKACADAFCEVGSYILCDNCAECALDWTEYQGERLCSDCYRGRDRSDYAL